MGSGTQVYGIGDVWYHTILLPDGSTTPGIKGQVWSSTGLPDDLTGLRVLDVGAAEGYFSFEAERRGAREVVALDQWNTVKSGGTDSTNSARHWGHIQWCHELLGSSVKLVPADLYDIPTLGLGLFDIVIFQEVLYHLEDPVRGLQSMSGALSGDMYVETLADERSESPSMLLNRPMVISDKTTFWIPTKTCIVRMLDMVGMKLKKDIGTRPAAPFVRWSFSCTKAI